MACQSHRKRIIQSTAIIKFLFKNTAVIVAPLIMLFIIASHHSYTLYSSNQSPSAPGDLSERCLIHDKHNHVSLCSCKADNRGLNQNVIAYSLYGNLSDPKMFARYVNPIKSTLEVINKVYPDWIVRIYAELKDGDEMENLKLAKFFDSYPFVDLCNVTKVMEQMNITRPIFQMTWRFLPLLDPTVDRLMSRDSDSRIIDREVDAVRQWLTESNATFHVMRDNVVHNIEILGGLWGAKIHQRRKAIKTAATGLFYNSRHKLEKQFDQDMLKKFIWPLAIYDTLAHDSYCCRRFLGTSPFPTQRQGYSTFVGQMVLDENDTNILPACPKKCRPKQHPDWIWC